MTWPASSHPATAGAPTGDQADVTHATWAGVPHPGLAQASQLTQGGLPHPGPAGGSLAGEVEVPVQAGVSDSGQAGGSLAGKVEAPVQAAGSHPGRPEAPDPKTSTFRVRPYTLTGGRTRTDVDLGLETQVRTTDQGLRRANLLALELKDIVEICNQPLSVAEVSAHLRVPLQVAKVLVGDLITSGDVESHAASVNQTGGRPDIQLLERVLEGLQSL